MSTSGGDGGSGDFGWYGESRPGDPDQSSAGPEPPPRDENQGWDQPGQGSQGWGGQPPGQQWQAPPYGQQPIPNYLPWAIVTTVLCCLPFGIVSIVYASQVNAKQAGGDIAGAMEASRKARTWAIAAASVGVVVILAYVLFFAAFGLSGVSDFSSP